MRFMRSACIVVLLASVASGESDGCAAGSEGSPTCREHVSLGDATSLLQLNNVKLETGAAAALTTRCSTAATSCEVGEWTEWGACSTTCGWGVRHRSRNVISAKSGEDCCLEEGETCQIKECEQGILGGHLCVNVREASNFENKIENAMVTLGDKGQKQSDGSGDVCWTNVAGGDYTLVAKHKDYIDETKTVSFVVSNMEPYLVDMVKKTTGDKKDWVIVLKWGEEGMVDLDAYTWLNGKDNDCKLAYDTPNKKRSCEDIDGTMDQDHCFKVTMDNAEKATCLSSSTSAKPETTTLKGVDGKDGEVVFQVVNHWGSKMCWIAPGSPLPSANFPPKDTGIFKQSKAEVTVYHGDQLVATYNAQKHGHWMWSGPCRKNPHASAEEWWLFSINRMTGTVTPCDCTTPGPGYCFGCGR